MNETDLEDRLAELRQATSTAGNSGHVIDTARAWRELRQRRARAQRRRRIGAAGSVALVAVAVLLAVQLISAGHRSTSHDQTFGHRRHKVTRAFSSAIVARVPVGGLAGAVVQDGGYGWAVTTQGLNRGQFNQLVKIDLRSDKVTLRVNLGHNDYASVAAGGGAVWVTTPLRKAQGQIVELNQATGQVTRTLHLSAGKCTFVSYSGGRLWAMCGINGSPRSKTEILRIDPIDGRVDKHSGALPHYVGPVAVAPSSIWYVTHSAISGLVVANGRARTITVHDPAYPVTFGLTDSLVYGNGFVWALTDDESVAKIDPATGKVVRAYSYKTYQPGFAGGLNFLAVGHGSLWFLDDGSPNIHATPSTGVLRVSIKTGQPLGFVPFGLRACGEPCFMISSTSSAIWVPTGGKLVRIDPARLPEG